jgi:hypothetical protein
MSLLIVPDTKRRLNNKNRPFFYRKLIKIANKMSPWYVMDLCNKVTSYNLHPEFHPLYIKHMGIVEMYEAASRQLHCINDMNRFLKNICDINRMYFDIVNNDTVVLTLPNGRHWLPHYKNVHCLYYEKYVKIRCYIRSVIKFTLDHDYRRYENIRHIISENDYNVDILTEIMRAYMRISGHYLM